MKRAGYLSNTQSSRCSSENKVTRSEMSCRWETKAFEALSGWGGHYFGQFVQHHNNKVLKIIKTLKLRKKEREGELPSLNNQPPLALGVARRPQRGGGDVRNLQRLSRHRMRTVAVPMTPTQNTAHGAPQVDSRIL